MYSVERPPEDWKLYPKSFLIAAIPILNAYLADSNNTIAQAFAKANHDLANRGMTHIRKLGGCPEIVEFNPDKKNSNSVYYSYKIKGSPALIYKIFVSLLDANGNILETKFGSGLEEPGTLIKSTEKGEVAAIRLTVKPWDNDKLVDSKTVTFKLKQPSLF